DRGLAQSDAGVDVEPVSQTCDSHRHIEVAIDRRVHAGVGRLQGEGVEVRRRAGGIDGDVTVEGADEIDGQALGRAGGHDGRAAADGGDVGGAGDVLQADADIVHLCHGDVAANLGGITNLEDIDQVAAGPADDGEAAADGDRVARGGEGAGIEVGA